MLYDQYQDSYEKGFKEVAVRNITLHQPNDLSMIPRKSIAEEYSLFFDESGHLRERISYLTSRNKIIKHKYAYNIDFRLVSIIAVDAQDNILQALNNLEYLNNGCLKSETNYDYDYNEECYLITKYSYSSKENVKKTHVQIDHGEFIETGCIFSRYSKEGDVLLEEKIVFENELHSWTKYEYDNENNVIKEITLTETGCVEDFRDIKTTRTKDGIIVEKVIENDKENVRMYVFEKNDKGHWVKQKIYKNMIMHRVIVRDIKYY